MYITIILTNYNYIIHIHILLNHYLYNDYIVS